ncbi:hypothetical protein PVAND_004139 [Polypedilum vanderplanki]|uniref:Amino acid transporter transmembrane domain-containing protein n=1 Tax=Polypedilum vanderplanki TaxID=319348 RepID=A0A9J6BX83_POLVA|nr:hypothetical protein PVAND_004139 [Polypedilum vanderplanki]
MDQYPTWVGFVFVFNLVVGTGSLLLPSAFAKTGYVLSTILVLFLSFTSYLTVTFVIETLSCSNALIKWRKIQLLKRGGSIQSGSGNERNDDDDSNDSTDDEERSLMRGCDVSASEDTPLTIQNNNFYTLNHKLEFGEMSKLFLPPTGSLLFYICIAIYLYGDMSIYSVTVSSTLRDVICDKRNISINTTELMTMSCFLDGTMNRFDAYRVCLIIFTLTLAPFVFFNVSKTKHLQFFTLSFRFVAFSIMIGIAIHRILYPNVNDEIPEPIAYDITNVPFLIGSLIYAFMSQHSLPSLLVPIAEKDKISRIVFVDYFLITALYTILALTGIFAFANVEDLYTLNFIPTDANQSLFFKIVEYFLALFPVFTLTTTFPIVGCTLRNNLQSLFVETSQMNSQNFFVRRMLFPLMAVIPPFLITFNTENVRSLVSFTGCYVGAFIQYLIPIILVYYARKTCNNILGMGIVNDFKSRFQSNFWLIMLFTWTCLSLIFVTINLFKS